MAREIQFIPMPEAQTRRLRTAAELPFKLEEQIGLNVNQLQTLCQISGFRHLRIENEQNSKTSKAAAVVIGLNQKGEALAGKAGIDTVPTSTYDFKPLEHDQSSRKTSRWHNLTISLNTEEMKQRMLLTDKDVRKAEHWVKDINKALTQGIVRAGVSQLVTNLDAGDILLASLVHGSKLMRLDNPAIFATLILTDAFFWNTWRGLVLNHPENFEIGSGHRWSIFVGPEIDRAIVLLGLAYTQKLAKKLK